MNIPHVEHAKARLSARAGSRLEISRRFGISYSWLCKFLDGRRPNPTVTTLDRLIKALDQLDAEDAARDRAA